MNIQEREEMDFHHSTQTEWDQADASQLGQENPESCWVLTDRDVWHKNPYYEGPEEPHPEDDWARENIEEWEANRIAVLDAIHPGDEEPEDPYDYEADDVPF